MTRCRKILWLLIAMIVPLVIRANDAAKPEVPKVEAAKAQVSKSEAHDRNTDRVALSLQTDVIRKVNNLIKKHRGTPQGAILLLQLLDAQTQAGSVEFRIAHFDSRVRNKTADLTKYHKRQQEIIDTCTEMIAAYPNHREIPRVYFARAEAYNELKKEALAKKDYDVVAERFPKTNLAVRSNLTLARYATDATQPRDAIRYLAHVELMPEDPHYPFAIYQLAWAHYNLTELDPALAYLKKYINYYESKAVLQIDGKLSASEQAFFDHGLRDVVTFFFEGYEKKFPGYALDDALPTFKKYQAGPALGRMLVAFAKLLRSRDLGDELKRWKKQVLDDEYERPEALEVVMVNFEFHTVRQGFKGVTEDTTADFIKLDVKTDRKMRKSESYPLAQATLLQTAANLQKAIVASKDKSEAKSLNVILKHLFSTFIAITDDSDPKLNQVHYNMAETLFLIGDFEESVQEYHWVVKNWKADAGLKEDEVWLKLLGARFQVLTAKEEIPKDLAPSNFPKDASESADLAALKKPVAEWIEWVDDYVKRFGRTPVDFEKFEFESNRILYSKNQQKAALARLTKFVNDQPGSKIAPAAASLVIDTYVFNQQWETTRLLAIDFQKHATLGDADFRKNLGKVLDSANFKLVEVRYQAKEYPQAIEMAKAYLASPGEKGYAPDCLYLASHSAHRMGDKALAEQFLSDLLTKYPSSEHKAFALLARADLSQAAYDFDKAGQDYRAFLASPSDKDRSDTIKRSWFVNWVSKNPQPINCKDAGKLLSECEKYQALLALATNKAPFADSEMVRLATKGFEENRALWSAVGLKFGKAIYLHNQWQMAAKLASQWKDLDPLIQFSLIPVLNQVVPEAFVKGRRAIPGLAKLTSNSDALTKRIELIRQIESAAAKAAEAPWSRIRTTAIGSIAHIYYDFCVELSKVPPPADLPPEEMATYHKTVQEIIQPFQAKGDALASQERELASVSNVNPSEAGVLGLSILDLAGEGSWEKFAVNPNAAQPTENLRALWVDALKNRSWPRMGYFFMEYREKGKAKETTLSLMKAVMVSLAGAQAEALADLKSAQRTLEAEQPKAPAAAPVPVGAKAKEGNS